MLPIVIGFDEPHCSASGSNQGGGGWLLRNGVIMAGKLDNVPELLTMTDGAVMEIAIGATRYVKRPIICWSTERLACK